MLGFVLRRTFNPRDVILTERRVCWLRPRLAEAAAGLVVRVQAITLSKGCVRTLYFLSPCTCARPLGEDMDEQKRFSLPEVLSGPKRPITPLYVILFAIAVIDVAAFSQIGNTSGWVQGAVTAFSILLAILIVGGLFLVLWSRPQNLYSPSEYGQLPSVKEFVDAMRNQAFVDKVEAKHVIEESEGQVVAEQAVPEDPDQRPEVAQPPSSEPKDATEWERVLVSEIVSDNLDFEKAEEAYKRVQAEQQDMVKRISNELAYLLARFRNGDTSALSQLETLAQKARSVPERAVGAYLHLGVAYQTAGSFQKAEGVYETALELAGDEVDRTRATMLLAHARFRLGRREEALETLKQAIASTTDGDSLANLYERLAQLYEESDEPELRALALEKALEHTPENTSLRFDAARAYDASDLDALSLLHYKRVLQISPRDAAAFNNAGVQYDALAMPTIAVDSYKKAYGLGNTLAAANLAYLYLHAGFTEDARRLLDEASTTDEPHPNVARATASISEKRERDEETEDSLLKMAREQQIFLSAYAQARFSPGSPPVSFAGTWRSEEGHSITISQQEEPLVGTWIADNKIYTLKGTDQGWTAKITKIGWKSQTSDYIYDTIANSGYAYMSPDGHSVAIMAIKGNNLTYMKLRRSN